MRRRDTLATAWDGGATKKEGSTKNKRLY